MLKFKRNKIVHVAVVAISVTFLVAGCAQPQSYSQDPTQSDLEFERGSDRPPTARTLYRLGSILAQQGKNQQAAAVLTNTIQRFPSFLPAYTELAQVQVRQRRFIDAHATLNSALERSPGDPVLLNDIGMIHVLEGNYLDALNSFERASASAPDNARYTSNRALAAGMLGRYDESLELYRRVVPEAEAHYNVALLAGARNEETRAAEEHAKAIAADPKIAQRSADRQEN